MNILAGWINNNVKVCSCWWELEVISRDKVRKDLEHYPSLAKYQGKESDRRNSGMGGSRGGEDGTKAGSIGTANQGVRG